MLIRGDSYSKFKDGIDALLFWFGLGIVIKPIDNRNRTVGYASSIKIYPQNSLNKEAGNIPVIEDFKKNKSFANAQKITFIASLDYLEELLSLSTASIK